ncbi:MAG: GHKL domain-containing protein [Peptococcaceae bacterium]|nr:GHKL domain-containing protein [Peptococcaceae bacterium]
MDEISLARYPLMMLVEGWEYYGERLLGPDDFSGGGPPPDEYVYIGYYTGFEAGDPDAQPHGSGTYRLRIGVPKEPQSYSLELPEIFSSYRAYINGRLTATAGETDRARYRPETLNRIVSFIAAEDIEIIIAVSDFSHLYSGMVYPPAFGSPDDVSKLLSARFLFRAALCTIALTIGLLSFIIGIMSRRHKQAILYGFLCLFFIGYAVYPIVKTFFSGYHPFYAIENFSFCAMFVVVLLLQRHIAGIENRWSLVFPFFGVFTCVTSLAVHLLLPVGDLRVMYAYSSLITAYEWVTAIWLTISGAAAVWKNVVRSLPVFIGALILDVALIMDRLLPLHEPVVTGWFPEIASFVLVLSVGAVIGLEAAEQYARNSALEEQARSMDRLLQMQRTYYPLIREKIDEARAARHDLRHHLVTISGLAESGQVERLKEYVSGYVAPAFGAEPVSHSQNEVADILAHYYTRLAGDLGIRLALHLDIGSESNVSDVDLSALLSNLLENAVEACRRQTSGEKYIDLLAREQRSLLTIRMVNSSSGVITGGSGFLSSKAEGRVGAGLESITAIARRYNGSAQFHYDENAKAFTSAVTLETE